MVAIFRRGPRLASARTPKLDRDERVVAWADADAGGVLVATNLGVFLPGHKDRLGWHEIHKAVWSGRQITITPAVQLRDDDAGYVVSADGEPETFALLDPREIPHEIRQRVTRSVAHTALHQVVDGAAVRVVGRRVPGVNGISWVARYEDGSDGADEAIREQTAVLIARSRDELQ